MRHKRLRTAIQTVLREHPDGLTAQEIIDNLAPAGKRAVSNAGHVANLIRGMKGVKKKKITLRFQTHENGIRAAGYAVNQYFYDDEGAEV